MTKLAAEQPIPACSSEQSVIASTADEPVSPASADEQISSASAEQLVVAGSAVETVGDRVPASISRYSRTLTPSRHAACPTDQPACFRSCSSIFGSIATGEA